MNVLSENLRRLRLTAGYTQEQLGQQLGVSAQSISRWECGTTLPDVMLLPALARIFAVTVDDLYREAACVYPYYAQRLVSVYEATGRTEDFLAAEQEFSRLLMQEHTADDLRSLGVLYHYMLRRCAARAQEHLDATIQAADRSDPVYSRAAHQKIALMCDLGRGTEEAERLTQVLQTEPDDALNWILCIAAHHKAGQGRRAYALAGQALDRFPENAILHIHAGNICRTLMQYEEAFSHWKRTLELDSSYMDALYAMGQCYEELGQYKNALNVWLRLHQALLRAGFVHECQYPADHIRLCRELTD